MFKVVNVLLSVWKRKSVLVQTNGQCKKNVSSQHRGTNMTWVELFLVSTSVLTTFLPDASAFSLLFEHRQKATLWAVLVPVVAT
jgi:hypothetical protein